MKKTQLDSWSLKAAGYDPERRQLEVELMDGKVYQYQDVSPLVSLEFFNAPSHGRYFKRYIKDHYLAVQLR